MGFWLVKLYRHGLEYTGRFKFQSAWNPAGRCGHPVDPEHCPCGIWMVDACCAVWPAVGVGADADSVEFIRHIGRHWITWHVQSGIVVAAACSLTGRSVDFHDR